MATLANASADFVEVLRRGLDAYDAGDHVRAYEIFDEALEIEADNVWGLLWKGATAPTPADARLWLEQALAIEPDNDHARAGLQWANEAAAATGEPFTPYEAPQRPTAAPTFVAEAYTEAATFSVEPEPAVMPSPSDADEGDEEDLPDWMRGDASPAAEMEEAEGFASVPPMSDMASVLTEDEDDLPDWLKADTPAAAGDLPDWMQSTTAPVANDEDDLPDWLRTETSPTPQTSDEDDLPDWLRDDGALAPSSDGAIPNWLDEPDAEPTLFTNNQGGDALPGWLDDEPETAASFSAPQGGAPFTPSPPSGDAEQVYRDGLMAYEENRLDDAVAAFLQTLQLDPNHIEAHNYLGSVYFLQGRTDEAIESLTRALELDPRHTESHLNLGLIYQETGQVQEAIRMFRRYLELAPDSDISTDVQGFIRELGG